MSNRSLVDKNIIWQTIKFFHYKIIIAFEMNDCDWIGDYTKNAKIYI